jgi:hypothetical protein
VGKEKRLIDYLTGIQQGDIVAPVLFLFLMLGVSQTFQETWTFTTPKYGHFKEKKCGKRGRLKNQNFKTCATYLILCHLLYVEDIPFIFKTLDDMTHEGQVFLNSYAQFGLLIHIGRRGNTSNSEALHIPNKLSEDTVLAGTIVLLDNKAYFHFTEQIKYLGSIVTYCPRDETDIAARVIKAHSTIGVLKDFSTAT